MSSATIYLARHATPDWTRTDIRYDVPPGPPLTEKGKSEAVQLGHFLQAAGVQRIYASPLERSQHTAELAATVAELPVTTVEAIAEWRREENDDDVLARMGSFWQKAVEESISDGPVAFVSHGGPIRAMLEELGIDADVLNTHRNRYDHRNPLPPAAAWKAHRPGPNTDWELDLAFVPEAATAVEKKVIEEQTTKV